MREKGYEIYSIRETNFGISDTKVIEIAAPLKGVILTEDKDFGELVFARSF